MNQPVKRLKSRRQYREKLSLKERQLDLAENSVKTVVPFTQSHCSEAEHSGDDHCSEAEQQPLCCSPSEHDILDRCSGLEQGFSSNNDKLNYEKCETVKQSSLSSGQENMTQIFVQPEPEHITPVTISTNDRADNLSSQIQPDDTLVDTVISSSEQSGHHESDCPIDYCSVCEKCGTGGFHHLASSCPNPVNCGLNHLSRSNVCEVWKKEKEIMKIKVTRNLTYLEARKIVEHTPETTFSTIVQSAIAKPENKNDYTQTSENDKIISSSTKILIPTKYKTNKSQPSSKASTPQSKQPSTSQVEPAKNRESRSKKSNKPKKEKPISKEKSKR